MTTIKERLSEFPFNMEKIKEIFGSKVEYLGIIAHPKVNTRVYAFYQPKPDRSKGHTEFFGLVYSFQNLFVMKLIGEELEQYQYHNAMICIHCKDEIISLDRWDYQECSCKKAMIDGGGSYTRISHGLLIKVNTLTKSIA